MSLCLWCKFTGSGSKWNSFDLVQDMLLEFPSVNWYEICRRFFLVPFEPAGILASSWTSRDIGFHLLANVKCIQWWQVLLCHWRELSQVPFLSQQKFCHDKYVFVTTNVCSSRQNMSFVVTKVCLLWQNYICHDESYVATNIIFSWQNFSHDKPAFFITKMILGAGPTSDSPLWQALQISVEVRCERHAKYCDSAAQIWGSSNLF